MIGGGTRDDLAVRNDNGNGAAVNAVEGSLGEIGSAACRDVSGDGVLVERFGGRAQASERCTRVLQCVRAVSRSDAKCHRYAISRDAEVASYLRPAIVVDDPLDDRQ